MYTPCTEIVPLVVPLSRIKSESLMQRQARSGDGKRRQERAERRSYQRGPPGHHQQYSKSRRASQQIFDLECGRTVAHEVAANLPIKRRVSK